MTKFFLLLVFAFSISACVSVDNKARHYFDSGITALDSGDYDTAIEHFTDVIKSYPQYVSSHNNRGLAYEYKYDYKSAINDYTKAISINPDNAKLYYNRARAREFSMKDKEDADNVVSDINQAIKLKPNEAKYYLFRGDFYYSRLDGRGGYEYEKGDKDLDMALKLDPSLADDILEIKKRKELHSMAKKP